MHELLATVSSIPAILGFASQETFGNAGDIFINQSQGVMGTDLLLAFEKAGTYAWPCNAQHDCHRKAFCSQKCHPSQNLGTVA